MQFGDRVEVERPDGRTQTYRIVGEDEADPAAGAVSWMSPLGQALLGHEVGEVVEVAGRALELLGFEPG